VIKNYYTNLGTLNGTACSVINGGNSITIRNNTFENLVSANSAGVIYIFHSSAYIAFPKLMILNNTFVGNTAKNFGGVLAAESIPMVSS